MADSFGIRLNLCYIMQTGDLIMREYKIEPILSPLMVSLDSPEAFYQSSHHIHTDSYEFYLLLSGDVTFSLDQKCYHLRPFDTIIIPPDMIHKADISGDVPYQRIVLHLKETSLLELSTPGTNLFQAFHDHAGQVYHLPEEEQPALSLIKEQLLLTCGMEDRFGRDVLQRSCILMLLIKSIANAKTSEHIPCITPDPLLMQVTEYIHEHYREDISIDQIAETFYVRRSSLCHRFREGCHISLWNYVISKRLIAARKLLCEGASVSDACCLSGFSDYAHFVKTFSNKFGISPGQYGKKAHGGDTIILS